MADLSINHLHSGGVITNYNCVSRCGHCLYNCGPHRSKNYLDREKAVHIFRCIRKSGCRSVHIGGGEPLLNLKKLLAVLDAARHAGVKIDYVETNSCWFIDHRQAVKILEQLRAAGVDTLLVSISPFHNAYIPFKRVRGVIEACRSSAMQVLPWVNDFVQDLSCLDENQTHSMTEFEEVLGPAYLQRIPARYWIHFGGRALKTLAGVYPLYSGEEILHASPTNCRQALADTSHFHIDLYGNYIPGLCAGLAVDMQDLGQKLPAGKYPLLDQLTAEGVGGLFDFAHQDYGYNFGNSGYVNHCHLCTEIRCFLLKADNERFLELAPVGFYTGW